MDTGRPQPATDSQREPLFISIARTALERGDKSRATLTLIQALRRDPSRIHRYGSIVLPMLAKAVPSRGLEDEVLTLVLESDPELGLYTRLIRALEEVGKDSLALTIKRAVTRFDDEPGATPLPGTPPVEGYQPAAAGFTRYSDSNPFGSRAGLPLEAGRYLPGRNRRDSTDENQAEEEETCQAPAFACDESRPRFGSWYDESLQRSRKDGAQGGVSVSMSEAWLMERLHATSGTADDDNEELDSSDSDSGSGSGEERVFTPGQHPDLSRMARPSLRSASSVDDLLSVAAAYAEPAPRHRSAIPRAAIHPRKRRLTRIGLIVLVIVSAAAAFGHIATETLDNAWRESDVESAEEAMKAGSPAGLQAARERSLAVLEEWPDDVAASGLAALSDQLISHRFDSEPEAASLLQEEPKNADQALAGVWNALHEGGPDAVQAYIESIPAGVWGEDEGALAWALGVEARARGQWAAAASHFGTAVRGYRRPMLPMLDLADLALSSQHHAAISMFLDLAPRYERNHKFVALARRLLSSDPLREGSDGLMPLFMHSEGLTSSQQGWYWLAAAWDALARQGPEQARVALEQGLEASPDNPELLMLSGLLQLEEGSLESGAELLVRGFAGLSGSVRFRQYRAHVVELLREAGHPDKAAALLGARPGDDTLPPLASLSADEIRWLAQSLLAAGERALTVKLLTGLPAHAPALIDVRLALLQTEAPRDLVPLFEDEQLPSSAGNQLRGLARTAYDRERLALEDQLYQEDWSVAFESAARLAAANPGRVEPLLIRAELLSIAGRGNDAAMLVESAMEGSVRGEILASLLRARAGEIQKEDRDASLSHSVTDVNLLAAQAEIAFRSGDRRRATELAERALERDSEHGRARAVLGLAGRLDVESRKEALLAGREGFLTIPGVFPALSSLLEEIREDKPAVLALVNALHRPHREEAHAEMLADFYVRKGWKKSGRTRLRDTVESLGTRPSTRPARGHLLYWLAMFYEPDEGTWVAAKYLKKARVLLGEDARILYQLGVYFQARNVPKLAQKFFRQARVIDPNIGS